MSRSDAHDEVGNPVLAVDPVSPAGQLVALLEWARRRGFRIGPLVKIDGLTVQVQDLRQTEGRHVDPPDDGSIWDQAGYEDKPG